MLGWLFGEEKEEGEGRDGVMVPPDGGSTIDRDIARNLMPHRQTIAAKVGRGTAWARRSGLAGSHDPAAAVAALGASPDLPKLRFSLCPARVPESAFWAFYFSLRNAALEGAVPGIRPKEADPFDPAEAVARADAAWRTYESSGDVGRGVSDAHGARRIDRARRDPSERRPSAKDAPAASQSPERPSARGENGRQVSQAPMERPLPSPSPSPSPSPTITTIKTGTAAKKTAPRADMARRNTDNSHALQPAADASPALGDMGESRADSSEGCAGAGGAAESAGDEGDIAAPSAPHSFGADAVRRHRGLSSPARFSLPFGADDFEDPLSMGYPTLAAPNDPRHSPIGADIVDM